jgi:hypothetical protein
LKVPTTRPVTPQISQRSQQKSSSRAGSRPPSAAPTPRANKAQPLETKLQSRGVLSTNQSATTKPKAKATKPVRKSLVRRKSSTKAAPTALHTAPNAEEQAAIVKLQRWWRMRVARDAAREGLRLLREWDALVVQVTAANDVAEVKRRAAVRLQRAARRRLRHRAALAHAAVRLQCGARRRLARHRRRALYATRLQCAARQRLARNSKNEKYWECTPTFRAPSPPTLATHPRRPAVPLSLCRECLRGAGVPARCGRACAVRACLRGAGVPARAAHAARLV